MNFFFEKIFSLAPPYRRIARVCAEFFLYCLVYRLTLFGSVETYDNLHYEHIVFLQIFNFVLWIPIYYLFNLQRDQLRFLTLKSFAPLVKAVVLVTFALAVQQFFLKEAVDTQSIIIFFLMLLNALTAFRITVRQRIRSLRNGHKKNVLILGTSDSEIQLHNSLLFSSRYNVVGFIADGNLKFPDTVAGFPVIGLDRIKDFSRKKNASIVVVIEESLESKNSSDLVSELIACDISVAFAPTIDRAFDYEVKLREIRADSLLSRPKVNNFDPSLEIDIANKEVLISGAGGSIGSELCRQLMRYKPSKLIMLDVSEFSLYTLQEELDQFCSRNKIKIDMEYYLGSVNDSDYLDYIFSKHQVQLVYHAAAYKHVPMLETNILAGVKNNIFGTYTIANAASEFGVEKFILVSTDKAVRPSNLMGATKRVSELICQVLFDESETIFSMVRFGNVLGSSGSVIPKFKQQIKQGGPVTVTHEEIVRYFMSIDEAAHLVLSAGAQAKGGEVFLLDMGKPVKVVDLAKSLIRSFGFMPVFESKHDDKPKDDTEIVISFSGLRPGEKLFEELLIDSEAQQTNNHKIFKANEVDVEKPILIAALQTLAELLEDRDEDGLIKFLKRLPLQYDEKDNKMGVQGTSNVPK